MPRSSGVGRPPSFGPHLNSTGSGIKMVFPAQGTGVYKQAKYFFYFFIFLFLLLHVSNLVESATTTVLLIVTLLILTHTHTSGPLLSPLMRTGRAPSLS